MELAEIIKKHKIEDIEKALIYQYLIDNNIGLNCHPFISEYMKDYNSNNILQRETACLKHNSLPELAVDMELLIPDDDRQTNGAFFTPAHIVDYIVSNVYISKHSKVIDISCGSGAFLLGAIKFFEREFNLSVSEIVKNNIYGVDILEYNIRRCKLLIILYGLTKGETINEDTINVKQANSLSNHWEQKYDAVIGNPPYVKFQDMGPDTRTLLENNFRTTSFGTYNLYFAFFEIGLNLLKEHGHLGYITPNNYFTSLSGESLRAFFHETKSITRIVDFNSTKVFDVQTYTAITFLSAEPSEAIEYARIKAKQSISNFLTSAEFTKNRYDELNIKKWRLLCNDEREVIRRIENTGTPIGKLYNIAVGIATLKDEVFFISPHKEDNTYYYCANKYKGDFKIEKSITRLHVKISKIKNADDLLKNNHRIIFPYSIDNGNATIISEEIMKRMYPECYSYLISVKDVLAQRGKGKHIYSPFYSYGRTQGLNKCGAKIYTPTFSQYPRFILDSDETSLFTNGYGIFFKNEIADYSSSLFEQIDNPIAAKENADVLLKILNSGLMHFYVSKTSVAIEGGYPCYQKNFIEHFCIPQIGFQDILTLRQLHKKEEIDSYLLKLYHLNIPLPNLWE